MSLRGIADEAVMIGDAASDMQMAWNAGVEPIAVLTGHLSRGGSENLGVKRVIENVAMLDAELDNLQAEQTQQ